MDQGNTGELMETYEQLAARVKVLEAENSALSIEIDRLNEIIARGDERQRALAKLTTAERRALGL